MTTLQNISKMNFQHVVAINIIAKGNVEYDTSETQNYQENYAAIGFMDFDVFNAIRKSGKVDNLSGFNTFMEYSVDYFILDRENVKDQKTLHRFIKDHQKRDNNDSLFDSIKDISDFVKDNLEAVTKEVLYAHSKIQLKKSKRKENKEPTIKAFTYRDRYAPVLHFTSKEKLDQYVDNLDDKTRGVADTEHYRLVDGVLLPVTGVHS